MTRAAIAQVDSPLAGGRPIETPADEGAMVGLPYHAVNDLDTLSSKLCVTLRLAAGAEGEAARRAALDAFLCAAGMSQILDDYIHRDVGDLTKVAGYAKRTPAPIGVALSTGMRRFVAIVQRVRWRTSERHMVGLAGDVDHLTAKLAARCVDASAVDSNDWSELKRAAEETRGKVTSASAPLRKAIAIPPRCFSSYDQSPDDCGTLAADFVERWPDTTAQLLVVGVRTSGSYLAPLVAAHLRRLGCAHVQVLSWRPDQPVTASELRIIKAVADARGLAIVVDDPPTSGGSVARVAADLERLGVPADSIVFLLQVFGSTGPWDRPGRLAGRHLVLMPFDRWAIHGRLTEEAVGATLGRLLAGRDIVVAGLDRMGPRINVRAVLKAERLPLPPTAAPRIDTSGREHVRALFKVLVADAEATVHSHHVLVRGSGIGFFGDQMQSIAERLDGYVPESYGAREGLFFRAWLPDTRRQAPDAGDLEAAATFAAAYVAARRLALPVESDLAPSANGHDALWERCARWAGASFGRLALPLRPALHGASRRLLHGTSASLIDGGMAAEDWFQVPSDGATGAQILKAGFEDRVYRHQIPFSYDAAFDVAVFAAGVRNPRLGDLARREYERLSGDRIDEERWFLYRLLHLLESRDLDISGHSASLSGASRFDGQGGDGTPASQHGLVRALTEGERALSRVHERYLGDVYMSDLAVPATGPLCAIDIDGVLETSWLSYPATTPAGALALRALARHGYRAVLATGRSLDEVRERCAAYRLAGGVAEYGGAVYDHRTERVEALLSEKQRDDLRRLRSALEGLPDVVVDPAHEHSLRAFRLAGGRRSGLEPELVGQLLRKAGLDGDVRAVHGWSQVDFVPASINKGIGLRRLAGLLGEKSDGRFLALAVGDTVSDLAMFDRARLAFAPADADAAVRAASGEVTVLKASYQRGLQVAVERLLGHAPDRCVTCSPPRLSGNRKLLINILAAQDRDRLGKIAQGVGVALGSASSDRAALREASVVKPGALPAYEVITDVGGVVERLGRGLAAITTTTPPTIDEERAGPALQCFIDSAGLSQVVEDLIHRSPLELHRVAARLEGTHLPLAVPAASLARGVGAMVTELRAVTWGRRFVRLQRDLASLSEALADAIVEPRLDGDTALLGEAAATLERITRLPHGFVRTVVWPPASFVTFDQHPGDCLKLVERFSARWGDRDRPVLVVGIRTSGSYLAPLTAAYLRSEGFRDVRVITWRPGHRWLRSERALLAGAAGRALALLVDDPPISGNTYARAAQELGKIGFAKSSIVMLLPLFDSPSWWTWRKTLQGYEKVELPFGEWTIEERLAPRAVRADLEELLLGRLITVRDEDGSSSTQIRVREVHEVIRIGGGSAGLVRGHVNAVYRVRLIADDGAVYERHLHAKGTGLGLLGQRSLTIAQQMAEFLPDVYGWRSGLLYGAWEPRDAGTTADVPRSRRALAARGAAYAAARGRRLELSQDLTTRLGGHNPLWQRCSDLLSPVLGRAALPARWVVQAGCRKLMRVSRPALIDGHMSREHWLGRADGQPLKTDFDDGDLSAQTPFCFDVAYDAASLAADLGAGDGALGDLVKDEFNRHAVEPVTDERWLLHQLLRLRSDRLAYQRDHRGENSTEVGDFLVGSERMMADLARRYFGQVWLGDLEPLRDGGLCAIDVDDMLETSTLSFPAITPAGALGLRALARHGYRAVLTSGLGLEDVRRRCADYRLAGGVAEHGAVIYNHATGHSRMLVGEADIEVIDGVRAALRFIPDVFVDLAYQSCVRAFRTTGGRRSGLSDKDIDQVMRTSGGHGVVRVIAGRRQTDFVLTSTDKSAGLRALAQELSGRLTSEPPTRLETISALIGHRPGSCPDCRAPRLHGEARLLADFLSAQDRGPLGKLAVTARLAWFAWQ